jgi:hypothetical protein
MCGRRGGIRIVEDIGEGGEGGRERGCLFFLPSSSSSSSVVLRRVGGRRRSVRGISIREGSALGGSPLLSSRLISRSSRLVSPFPYFT